METSRLRSVWMSRTSGMFSSTPGSSVRMAAAIAGRAAFFAPLTRMFPSSGLPPRITNLSIRFSGTYTAEPSNRTFRPTGSFLTSLTPFTRLETAGTAEEPVSRCLGMIFIQSLSECRSPFLDRLSDIPLSATEFLRRLLPAQTSLEHDERHCHSVARTFERLLCFRMIQTCCILQNAHSALHELTVLRVHV